MDSTSTVSTASSDGATTRSAARVGQSMVRKRPGTAGSGVHQQETGGISAKDQMLALTSPISDQLHQVEKLLQSELKSRHSDLEPVLQHGTQLGGKRLRPALLLLVGKALGGLKEDHVVLGTVVEMVHTATLIHDDVLDQAATRRHVPTVNARWNEHTSILIGDYLFAQSFRLAATLSSTHACQLVGEAARLVCEGELRQVLSRDILNITENDYLQMIRGKTAELCRVSCELGAIYAGGDEAAIRSLGHYGDALGIAFQIADDFLDLWGNDQTVGKTLGTDIEQGKMTLPLIRLRETVGPSEWGKISGILRGPINDRLPRIMPILQRSDARAYTQQVAESYKKQAIDALDCLPEGASKKALTNLACFSVSRRF